MRARALTAALVATAAIGAAPAAHAADRAAVVHWNEIAQSEIVPAQPPPSATASLAFVQLAVYDAVVAIEGGYEPYGQPLQPAPGASVDAAVATAAHDVLVRYFPADRGALDDDLAASKVAIPDGPAEQRGQAVGQQAAAGLLAERAGDGWQADIGFTMPAPGPGVWELPAGQTPLVPWLSRLRPFTLHSPDQFRPGPVPALTSRRYARDFDELERLGGAVSDRTPEQTLAARFYTTHPVLQFATAYREVAARQGLDALQTARLMAMGSAAGADAQIACYDAKYTYLAWRPAFAIPRGDTDGNRRTVADPGWTPLLPTPTHPEYPSGHSCLTFAEVEVFERFLGTQRIDLDLPGTIAEAPMRHFATGDDLRQDVANARVWGGLHFRFSTEAGGRLGTRVADWTLTHAFRPQRRCGLKSRKAA
jgi:vanadium-dependent haloperoxidase-like protein